jgi:hypothetical protein
MPEKDPDGQFTEPAEITEVPFSGGLFGDLVLL